MTQTIAVNAQNDMYVDELGNLAMAFDLQAVLQACAQAAKTILGEMVLQTNDGIPYFETVFVGVPNIAQFQTALLTAWRAVPDVVQVASLDISRPGNTLIYNAVIITSFGSGAING